MSFFDKFKGDGASLPPKPTFKVVSLAWLGGFLAIAAVAMLTDFLSLALVLGSFGASCVLVFGYPDVPFSQPRNVVAGHVISSLVGLVFLTPLWRALVGSCPRSSYRHRVDDAHSHSASTCGFKSRYRFFNATGLGIFIVSHAGGRTGFSGRRPRLQQRNA